MKKDGLWIDPNEIKTLEKSLEELGKTPQKYVTEAAKKAMTPVAKGIKADAPYQTGALEDGIKLIGEKNKPKGKKVYEILFDRSYNGIFQKDIKNPGLHGSPHPHRTGYYPVSIEYGWFASKGNYIPGRDFVHRGFDAKVEFIEATIIRVMRIRINAQIAKEGLK